MMQLTLNVPDDIYEKLRVGMNFGGFFTISFKDIEQLGIDFVDIKHLDDVE